MSRTPTATLRAVPVLFPVTEHFTKSARHSSFYLACGPETGPLIIFVHGWPELSHSWRHQLRCFAALGFRCVAPDMRGYGRSSIYRTHADYALEHSVHDMLDLLAHLGRERAVWVGHDWGSPVVWNIASHHPERCHAVGNLCVPYIARGFAPANLIPLVNRETYPDSTYPAGQWEYQLFYEEHFDRARAVFEADVENTILALFRKGDPAGRGKPSRGAEVRRDNGWFGGADKAPSVPRDSEIISEEDLSIYAASLARTGFFGPDSWYMNVAANIAYAAEAKNGGKLALPVLFLHGAYDYVCETIDSRFVEPMRRDCTDLTEVIVASGHWMAQEQPVPVNAALAKWLATKMPDAWPV
jgi:pimeloyl-ACP methyl ester carboxylesterase